MLSPDQKEEINGTLRNWGYWCRGGWPPLKYSIMPTSRDYLPVNQVDKPLPRPAINVTSAEAANHAIVNLALNGDTRSYQLIAAWYAHHRPAKQIARDLHCSLASVYNYRLYAMLRFWPEYQSELKKKPKRKKYFDVLRKMCDIGTNM